MTAISAVVARAVPLVALAALSFVVSPQAALGQPRPTRPDAVAVASQRTAAGSIAVDDSAERLLRRGLVIPVDAVPRSDLRDSFHERRGAGPHEAIDIAATRGTQVVAADDGRVVKLFRSVPGGLTVYQFDPEEQFAYYYAHLDAYADRLREGMVLKRGEVLGYVGTTGNAPPNAPHLHFAIFRLGPERKWWQGTAIDPYPFLNEAER